jgi:Mn-dependent DtxR family transcriptional regulator
MSARRFTEKQGQYLAFIHAYTKIMKQPPAVADFARYFEVTPPTAQRMVMQLAKLGLIEKTPGAARSIRLTVPADELPILD